MSLRRSSDEAESRTIGNRRLDRALYLKRIRCSFKRLMEDTLD